MCALRDASVRCEALDALSVRRNHLSLLCRFGGAFQVSGFRVGSPTGSAATTPQVSGFGQGMRPPVSLLTSGAERSLRFCRIPVRTSVHPTSGSVDGNLRHGTFAKFLKDLEGDPSPGRTGSGCTFNCAARFQTPTGSKATKSSKRHGGKGCSDATRLRRRKILRGVRTCIAGKAIAPETR